MKKVIVCLTLVSVIAAGSVLSAKAVQNAEKERGYVSINTSAEMDVSPDIAELSFAIKTSDTKSMQKAAAMNKEASDKVYGILKSMINTQNGDYIKTSNYNASPVYTYNGNKRNLDKYEVSNRVMVHTKSIDKLGMMIDKSIESGATNVDSLNFSVSNYESQCNSLIESAAKKANSRATIAARTAGTTLDGIKSMSISCSDTQKYSTPRLYMAKNMLSAVADSSAEGSVSTSVSEGTVKVNANVNAVFYVK